MSTWALTSNRRDGSSYGLEPRRRDPRETSFWATSRGSIISALAVCWFVCVNYQSDLSVSQSTTPAEPGSPMQGETS